MKGLKKVAGGPFATSIVGGRSLENSLNTLNTQEKEKIQSLVSMVDKLANLASEKGVGLIIDAEETWYQRAIELLTLQLQSKYNKDQPVVWNSLQMYLKRTAEDLERVVALANGRFQLAVKIVRGAYMASEERVHIHDTMEDTNKAYNSAIKRLLDIPTASVLVATHNYESVVQGLEIFESKNSESVRPGNLSFGQLYGMNDDITYAIATSGVKVFKFLP